MRVPLILSLTALALVLIALWLDTDPETPTIGPRSTTQHLIDGYRVGHDWVEPPFESEGQHPLLKGNWQSTTEFQCTQPECRTCQWMRMFGGEW